MDCITLTHFRASLYACFATAGDTLLNIVDALATEPAAQSLLELALSTFFPRQWSRLYQGVQNARIDRAALRRVFAASAPLPASGKRLVLGIDASSLVRPCSPTARDRTDVHVSNLPEGSKPVAAGWQFSTLTVLPPPPSSWQAASRACRASCRHWRCFMRMRWCTFSSRERSCCGFRVCRFRWRSREFFGSD